MINWINPLELVVKRLQRSKHNSPSEWKFDFYLIFNQITSNQYYLLNNTIIKKKKNKRKEEKKSNGVEREYNRHELTKTARQTVKMVY